MAEEEFEILNLSPSGVKFKGNLKLKLNHMDEYPVAIIFAEQKPHQTIAKFVRKVGDLYALTFITKIPRKTIENEAKRQIKVHGEVFIS